MSEAEKTLMAQGIRRPTIIVDWDGTCVPSAWPERPKRWLPGAKAALRHFLSLGYDVKIHTVRTHSSAFDFSGPNPDREADLAYIREMLDTAGLRGVDIVLDDKPPAVFYIDDRAVRFDGSWLEVINDVNAMHDAGEEVKGDVTDVAQAVKS